MNQFRRGLSEKAFKIMDKDRNGILNIDDIKDIYNAKKHPDVIKGKKIEEKVIFQSFDFSELQLVIFLKILLDSMSKDFTHIKGVATLWTLNI